MRGLRKLGGTRPHPCHGKGREFSKGCIHKFPGVNGLDFELPDERFGVNISVSTGRQLPYEGMDMRLDSCVHVVTVRIVTHFLIAIRRTYAYSLYDPHVYLLCTVVFTIAVIDL